MTPEQKQQAEKLYADGIGYSTIANIMKIKASIIRRHLASKGLLRTQAEAFQMRRVKHGFGKIK